MIDAYIGLGSNMGDRLENLAAALRAIADLPDTELVGVSQAYESEPWGVEDQPPFINSCLVVDTVLAPHALLDLARKVERLLGRNRAQERRWGPRTLDIDLIAYDDEVIDEPDLQLPHPRLFERAFVLMPLSEIVPDRMIGGITVRDALARVDTRGIVRLPMRG